MIPFEDIDSRLEKIGKDRQWLAAAAERSYNSIRAALAPNSAPKNRSRHIQKAMSDAILAEEAKKTSSDSAPLGILRIFLTEDQHDLADRASRIAGAPSLSDYCREVLMDAAERALEEEAEHTGSGVTPYPLESLKVAEEEKPYRPRSTSGGAAPASDIETLPPSSDEETA